MTKWLKAIGKRLKTLLYLFRGECPCQSCGRWAPRCHLKIDWKNSSGEGTYEADLCPTCYHAKLKEWEYHWDELTRRTMGFDPFKEFKR